tara:strand:+ start:307 stop:735 length:429 start_codon:yes stop_codon:yes gene_type:complete
MKTTFGPGVIVTSKWLNSAKEIYFDGQDLDFHYSPINLGDIQRGGTNGLDTIYVTTSTDQLYGSTPITGQKSFMGRVQFGDEISANPVAAPSSWSTNAKFNVGGSNQNFSVKFANLKDEDLVTKAVIADQINNFPIIDEGAF